MFCPNCGSEMNNDATFCPDCGARIIREADSGQPEAQPVQPVGQQRPINNTAQFNVNAIPEEYRPISMWGYFGYEILFTIPIVGFICLIIFALIHKNHNVKNFARSYFCFYILLTIISAVIGFYILSLGGFSFD